MLLLNSNSLTRARENRGFISSLFGNLHQEGSRWVQSMQDGVEEVGKVAQVLAEDASDAIKTVSFGSFPGLFHA